MAYLYLISTVFLSASTSIFGKAFNRKNEGYKDVSIFYNLLMMISVFSGWGILFLTDLSFNADVLWYSVIFAIGYTTANVGIINALKYGPATLSALLTSLSLILVTIWGFIFWGDTISAAVLIGLVLVVLSITLCIYTKEKDDKSISGKWIFYISLAFLGNAGCSITQRTQQVNFNGEYGNMLMFFATGLSLIASLVLYLRSNKSDSKIIFKKTGYIPILAGIGNLIMNVFVMLLATSSLSPSLIYPVIGVGALAVVTVFSLLVFKERMYPWQWLGVVLGAVAVALLSI